VEPTDDDSAKEVTVRKYSVCALLLLFAASPANAAADTQFLQRHSHMSSAPASFRQGILWLFSEDQATGN